MSWQELSSEVRAVVEAKRRDLAQKLSPERRQEIQNRLPNPSAAPSQTPE
jgi:hypothetical protein